MTKIYIVTGGVACPVPASAITRAFIVRSKLSLKARGFQQAETDPDQCRSGHNEFISFKEVHATEVIKCRQMGPTWSIMKRFIDQDLNKVILNPLPGLLNANKERWRSTFSLSVQAGSSTCYKQTKEFEHIRGRTNADGITEIMGNNLWRLEFQPFGKQVRRILEVKA